MGANFWPGGRTGIGGGMSSRESDGQDAAGPESCHMRQVSRRDHFGESVTEEEMRDYVWLRPELIVQVEFSDEGWRREVDSNARFRFTV